MTTAITYLNDLQPFLPRIIFWAVCVIVLGGIYYWMSKNKKYKDVKIPQTDFLPTHIQLCGAILDELTVLSESLEEACENPPLFEDSEWKSGIFKAINDADASLQQVRAYDPSEDLGTFEDLHGELLSAISGTELLTEYIATHIDELSLEDSEQLYSKLESAGAAIDKVLTDLIKEVEISEQ
ncbi:MAG: hypothetical protein LBN34_09200 [Clostridiales Family XIII bacterium]|jgi:hypothetical protein|nr:hypothetical protein [Clostridiales Family XIII bacterium]